jgi:hypothetical protein
MRPTFERTEERFALNVYAYAGRVDAVASIAAARLFTANPVERIDAVSTIIATEAVTWNPVAAGIAATATLAAAVSATVASSQAVGPIPMRRVSQPIRSWTRIELPRLYAYTGRIVGAKAFLSGTVRYRDRAGKIQVEDDDALLELLLL